MSGRPRDACPSACVRSRPARDASPSACERSRRPRVSCTSASDRNTPCVRREYHAHVAGIPVQVSHVRRGVTRISSRPTHDGGGPGHHGARASKIARESFGHRGEGSHTTTCTMGCSCRRDECDCRAMKDRRRSCSAPPASLSSQSGRIHAQSFPGTYHRPGDSSAPCRMWNGSGGRPLTRGAGRCYRWR